MDLIVQPIQNVSEACTVCEISKMDQKIQLLDVKPSTVVTTFGMEAMILPHPCPNDKSDDRTWETLQKRTHRYIDPVRMKPMVVTGEGVKWIDMMVLEREISETWVNSGGDQNRPWIATEFEKAVVPRPPNHLYREFTACLENLEDNRHLESGPTSDLLLNAIEGTLVLWRRNQSLPFYLAEFEFCYGNLPKVEYRDKLCRVFSAQHHRRPCTNGYRAMPGYAGIIEHGISTGVDEIMNRFSVYRRLMSFHAKLYCARHLAPSWPEMFDVRDWILLKSDEPTFISEDVQDEVVQRARWHTTPVVELRTQIPDSRRLAEEFVGPVFLEGDFAPNQESLALFLRRKSGNPDSYENQGRFAAISTLEDWYHCFPVVGISLQMTLVTLVEKVWFKLHLSSSDFVNQFLNAFDISVVMVDPKARAGDMDEVDFSQVLEKIDWFYRSNVRFATMNDLKILPGNAEGTFENFVVQYASRCYDPNLSFTPAWSPKPEKISMTSPTRTRRAINSSDSYLDPLERTTDPHCPLTVASSDSDSFATRSHPASTVDDDSDSTDDDGGIGRVRRPRVVRFTESSSPDTEERSVVSRYSSGTRIDDESDPEPAARKTVLGIRVEQERKDQDEIWQSNLASIGEWLTIEDFRSGSQFKKSEKFDAGSRSLDHSHCDQHTGRALRVMSIGFTDAAFCTQLETPLVYSVMSEKHCGSKTCRYLAERAKNMPNVELAETNTLETDDVVQIVIGWASLYRPEIIRLNGPKRWKDSVFERISLALGPETNVRRSSNFDRRWKKVWEFKMGSEWLSSQLISAGLRRDNKLFRSSTYVPVKVELDVDERKLILEEFLREVRTTLHNRYFPKGRSCSRSKK